LFILSSSFGFSRNLGYNWVTTHRIGERGFPGAFTGRARGFGDLTGNLFDCTAV